MTSKLATETGRRLAEATAALNALERRLDEIEDLVEAAWDEVVAPPTGDGTPSENTARDTG